MNQISVTQSNLPTNIDDLAKFALIGRERLVAVRAEIRAIEKVGLAQEVRQQKLREAQEISEAVLDAEVKIGELTSRIPKATQGTGGNRYTKAADRVRENDTAVHFSKQSTYQTTVVPKPIAQPKPTPEPQKAQPTKPEIKQTKADVIKEAGFTEKQVQRFEQLAKHPEIVERAKAEARENDDIVSRSQVLNMIKVEKRAERENKREEKRQDNAVKVETLATPLDAVGLFQTIVIDPPWDWGDEGDVNQMGRAKPDYHTMPIDEIMKLPINKIADDNCHLYIWVTNRSLPKAFKLVEAWGFRYVTCLTWVKPSFGMGNYFRGSTEQVLFCVKGSQPLKRHDVGTHFEAPRGDKHSAKPEEFYKLVESCSYGPYIDIFGRKDREGWSVWGENG